MIRGTTPTFSLKVADTVDLTDATNVYATFQQKDMTITKTGSDIEVSAHQVDVYMSQAETLSFKTGQMSVQLNWTYSAGSRACTEIKSVTIYDNLLPKVLT